MTSYDLITLGIGVIATGAVVFWGGRKALGLTREACDEADGALLDAGACWHCRSLVPLRHDHGAWRCRECGKAVDLNRTKIVCLDCRAVLHSPHAHQIASVQYSRCKPCEIKRISGAVSAASTAGDKPILSGTQTPAETLTHY